MGDLGSMSLRFTSLSLRETFGIVQLERMAGSCRINQDLRVNIIFGTAAVFNHSRPEQSPVFSDVVSLPVSAPHSIKNSSCFLQWQRVFWSHYLTPHGCLRFLCDSIFMLCRKVADGFEEVLDIRKDWPIFEIDAICPPFRLRVRRLTKLRFYSFFSKSPSKLLKAETCSAS
uniref:Uncharacterized protein n=1 Tax=Schistocephalus solidus TaxID=70667 RepID=A0A0X3PXV4_SCHSO